MKSLYRIIRVLGILLLLYSLNACENQEIFHSIAGKTYRGYDESGMVSIYFAKNHDCTITTYESASGYSLVLSNLEYKIVDTTIEIRYDNSSFWLKSARGKVFQTLTYNPSIDVVFFMGYPMYPQ